MHIFFFFFVFIIILHIKLEKKKKTFDVTNKSIEATKQQLSKSNATFGDVNVIIRTSKSNDSNWYKNSSKEYKKLVMKVIFMYIFFFFFFFMVN